MLCNHQDQSMKKQSNVSSMRIWQPVKSRERESCGSLIDSVDVSKKKILLSPLLFLLFIMFANHEVCLTMDVIEIESERGCHFFAVEISSSAEKKENIVRSESVHKISCMLIIFFWPIRILFTLLARKCICRILTIILYVISLLPLLAFAIVQQLVPSENNEIGWILFSSIFVIGLL